MEAAKIKKELKADFDKYFEPLCALAELSGLKNTRASSALLVLRGTPLEKLINLELIPEEIKGREPYKTIISKYCKRE